MAGPKIPTRFSRTLLAPATVMPVVPDRSARVTAKPSSTVALWTSLPAYTPRTVVGARVVVTVPSHGVQLVDSYEPYTETPLRKRRSLPSGPANVARAVQSAPAATHT